MVEVGRNILAFVGTFIVIATVVMMFLHGIIAIVYRKRKLSSSQERFVVYTGIAVALLLTPFYYFPA